MCQQWRPDAGRAIPLVVRPSLRKEMAEWAVRYRSASIALACRTFSISETCYRYQPKLSDENELIADWLVAVTTAEKTWGFGLCFLAPAQRQGLWLEPQARVPHLS